MSLQIINTPTRFISTMTSTSPQTGTVVVNGGVGIGGNINSDGIISIHNTSPATNGLSGALQINGGIGVSGNIYIAGTSLSTSSATGALNIMGGVGIGGNLYIDNTIQSTDTQTGSLIIKGGVGIGGTLIPSQLQMTNTVSMIDNDITMTANSASRLVTQYSIKKYVDNEATLGTMTSNNLAQAVRLLKNPTGFEDRTSTIISFSDTSRIFTIAGTTGGSFSYYVNGVEKIVTSPATIQISNTSGIHLIYFDDITGLLSDNALTVYQYITQKVPVAYVYWNPDTGKSLLVGDERHGTAMSPDTHYNLHVSQGTAIISGGDLGGFTGGNGSSLADGEFSVAQCEILDEDINSIIPTIPLTGIMNIAYYSGTSWAYGTTTGAYYSTGKFGNPANYKLYYNHITSVGSLAQVSTNYYVLGHVLATNGISCGTYSSISVTSGSFVTVLGQAQYSTVALARSAVSTEVKKLFLGNGILTEFVVLASVIYLYKNKYPTIVSINATAPFVYWEDWRQHLINASVVSVISHSSLTNLTVGDDHPQYVRVDGINRTTDYIKFTNTNSGTDATTGSLVISGGIGITGNINSNGIISIHNTSLATNGSSGALDIAGGVGIAGNLFLGNTTQATDTQTGSLIVKGGVGIGENLCVGGTIYCKSLVPSVYVFTTVGTSSYTPSINTVYFRVRMVGGGGGGTGSGYAGSNLSSGTNGSASSFGGSLIANGGSGGNWATGYGGDGGNASNSFSGAYGISMKGSDGCPSFGIRSTSVLLSGGNGGTSPFGGSGKGGFTANGGNAYANSGSGGGGAGSGQISDTLCYGGYGGGSGGYIDVIITTFSITSYTVVVGSGGNGVVGGGGVMYNGGDGGSGIVVVEEYHI